MFQDLPPYAGDPILTLNQTFQSDPRPGKVNLSIGVYLDSQGRLPVMESVRQAALMLQEQRGPCPYQPMEGAANYRQAAQQLLFGTGFESEAGRRIATLQTIGGSGALRLAADFLYQYRPRSQVWLSDPSWANHRAVFEGAGFKVHSYPYYDPASGGLRFQALVECLSTLPAGSIVLLHACCHNPTGVDLSAQQWRELMPLFAQRELLPFIDIAYQGFGAGVEEDACPLRLLLESGRTFFTASSFSKNFSLYGERCGVLSVVCEDAAEATLVLGQLKATVRRSYSSPPTHGGQLIATVLQSQTLQSLWRSELEAMRERILAMRGQLRAALERRLPGEDWSYLTAQQGMFSYTGLNAARVDTLRERHGVYMLSSGRLCVAGLSESNVAVVAEAIAAL
jgi:aromatic-amino-acid transaminase